MFKKKKIRESCFPEPLGNPTTELGLFAYASKTLSSQRSAQKASFLCLLWHNFQWFLGDCLAFGLLVAFTLLLARRLQLHEALLSPEHRSHSRGSFSVPSLKQESWTFTSVYPKIIGFFFFFAYISINKLPSSCQHHSTDAYFSFCKLNLSTGEDSWFPCGSTSVEISRTEDNLYFAPALRTLKDLCPAFIYCLEQIKPGFVLSKCFILGAEGKVWVLPSDRSVDWVADVGSCSLIWPWEHWRCAVPHRTTLPTPLGKAAGPWKIFTGV